MTYTEDTDALPGEVWADIRGTYGKYQVSNIGRVKSLKHAKPILLSTQINNHGYQRVTLSVDGKPKQYSVHRLVAIEFIENDNPIEKTTVDHINANKLDNRAVNLRWLSRADNSKIYYSQQRELKKKHIADNRSNSL